MKVLALGLIVTCAVACGGSSDGGSDAEAGDNATACRQAAASTNESLDIVSDFGKGAATRAEAVAGMRATQDLLHRSADTAVEGSETELAIDGAAEALGRFRVALDAGGAIPDDVVAGQREAFERLKTACEPS